MEIISLASGSSGNCYLIKQGKDVLMIEAGLSKKKLKESLWDNNILVADIETCLISHHHQDHIKSAKFLSNHGVTIILPKTDRKAPLKHPTRKDRVCYLEGGKIYKNKHFVVRGMELEHDGTYNLGYLVKHIQSKEQLFYATDTMYIRYKANNINYYLIEVNYQKKYLEEAIKDGIAERANTRRVRKTHMSLETAIEFFKQQDLSKTKEIWLLHLSERNCNPDEVKEEIQKVTGVEVYLA